MLSLSLSLRFAKMPNTGLLLSISWRPSRCALPRALEDVSLRVGATVLHCATFRLELSWRFTVSSSLEVLIASSVDLHSLLDS